MEGMELDGISDVESGYGTPAAAAEALLTRIDNELAEENLKLRETLKNEIKIKEDLRKEIERLNKDNEEINENCKFLKTELGKLMEDYLKLDSEYQKMKEMAPLLETISSENEKLNKTVDILNERNFQTEVKMSKTRKYLKHRERETGEEIDTLRWEINDWNKDFYSLEKEYFNLQNVYFRDTESLNQKSTKLLRDCNNLQKLLNNSDRDSGKITRLIEKCKFLEFNASMVAGNLIQERNENSNLKAKINELQNCSTQQEEKLKIKIGEINNLDEEFKETLKELENLKNNPVENGKPNEEVEKLKKVVEKQKKELDGRSKKITVIQEKLEKATKDYAKYKNDMDKDYKTMEALNREYMQRKSETLNNSEKEELEKLRKTVKKYYNCFNNEEDLKNEIKGKNETLMKLRAENASLEQQLKTAKSPNEAKGITDEIFNNRRSSGIKLIQPDEEQLQIITEISKIDATLNTITKNHDNYHWLTQQKIKLETKLNSLLLITPEIPERNLEEDEKYALKPIETETQNLSETQNISVEDCSGGNEFGEFEYFVGTDSDYYDENW